MNIQQKAIILVLVLVLVVIVAVFLFFNPKIVFSSTNPAKDFNQPEYSMKPIMSFAPAEDTEAAANYEANGEPETNSIDEDASFKPISNDTAQFATLLLSGDVAQFASSGLPVPNTSLYKVNTRSYMQGLGDPFRGDVEIKPLNTDLIKSKYSVNDLRKGAISSIG